MEALRHGICRSTSLSEIRSAVTTNNVCFDNDAGEHHSTRRKEPPWDPKSSLHRAFIRQRRTYISPIGPFTFPQNDVEEYVGGPDAAVERVIAAFQDVLACVSHSYNALSIFSFCTAMCCRKYRYMDSNLTQRRRGLEEKIPEIKKTLSMVEFLRDRQVRLFFLPFFCSFS